jgi:hypothetical protein
MYRQTPTYFSRYFISIVIRIRNKVRALLFVFGSFLSKTSACRETRNGTYESRIKVFFLANAVRICQHDSNSSKRKKYSSSFESALQYYNPNYS